jgi:Hypothetical glycosyl hydrolase 6
MRHPVWPRRDFLKAAGLAVSTLAIGDGPADAALLSTGGRLDKSMRWAQLTLVEDDPGKYDLGFWLGYMKRTHSDATCLSAGGYVAFYPTKIPLHYRSQWLGNMDPFGDLVAGCRKMNMVVVARTDPHAVHQDVYDAHPDWIAVARSRSWSARLKHHGAKAEDGSKRPPPITLHEVVAIDL